MQIDELRSIIMGGEEKRALPPLPELGVPVADVRPLTPPTMEADELRRMILGAAPVAGDKRSFQFMSVPVAAPLTPVAPVAPLQQLRLGEGAWRHAGLLSELGGVKQYMRMCRSETVWQKPVLDS